MYPIIQNFIDSRNRPRTKLIAQGGVVHATATPGATDESERTYFEIAYRDASANTFIDWDSITEIIPLNEVSWGSGATSNHKFFQVELCEPASYNISQFNEVWNRAVWYFASKFIGLNIKTVTKDNLMGHMEVSAKWHETDHQDPVAYFGKYGRNVDNFRVAVQLEINHQLNKVDVVQPSAPKVYVYVVVLGDTLGKIAAKFDTTVEVLQELNGIQNANILQVGPAIKIAKKIVRVQKGDTLAIIARLTKVDVIILAKINNLPNVNDIKVGQILIVE